MAEIAGSDAYAARLRAEAIVGLTPKAPEVRALLVKLATGHDSSLRAEALRSLRGATLDEDQRQALAALANKDQATADLVARVLVPVASDQPDESAEAQNTDHWLGLLHGSADDVAGDPQAGERIFFHRQSAACARCHQIGGRGAKVGPELTATTGTLSERRLVESIVRPARRWRRSSWPG